MSRSSSRSGSSEFNDGHQFSSFARSTTSFLNSIIARYDDIGSDNVDVEQDGPVLAFTLRVVQAIMPISNFGQMLFGGAGGWLTGLILMKLGKVVALLLGAGLLSLQFFHYCEYVQIDWERVHRDLSGRGRQFIRRSKVPSKVEEVFEFPSFVDRTKHVSIGFIGGFFLGVALA